MSPKVSICIPAYKQPDFLYKTLQSVSTQSFDDYEVIITDDSPDDSVENVIKEFQSNKKLRYFRNRERKGSPENWNEAIRLASGEYIKILHHDDWFTDGHSLAKFVEALDQNAGCDFAFSSCRACDDKGKIKFLHSANDQQIAKLRKSPFNLYPQNFIGAPSVTIYRRNINKKFDPLLKWVVDIDFYINVLRGNKNFIFIPSPLVSINTESDNKVTKECSGEKSVEIFEWLYLFFKLKNIFKFKFNNLKFIFYLLSKYEIQSIRDLYRLREVDKLSKIVVATLYFKKLFFIR